MSTVYSRDLGLQLADVDEPAPVFAGGLPESSSRGASASERSRDSMHREALDRDPVGAAAIDAAAQAKAHAEFGALQRSAGVYEVEGLRIIADPLVYHPGPGSSTHFTLRSLPVITAHRVLDLGTGSGAIAIVLARAGNQVLATDIREEALRCARANVAVHGVAVELRASDVFAAITADERFDAVVFNIPFFAKEIEHDFEVVACDPESALLRRFLAGLREHLTPGGRGYLVFSNLGDPRILADACAEHQLRRRLLTEEVDGQTGVSRQLWELSEGA
jgi:methylase of polypeptide subunit release factors